MPQAHLVANTAMHREILLLLGSEVGMKLAAEMLSVSHAHAFIFHSDYPLLTMSGKCIEALSWRGCHAAIPFHTEQQIKGFLKYWLELNCQLTCG